MSKYSKQHYEDMAKLLRIERDKGLEHLGDNQGSTAIACVMLQFVSLFAADNPDYCGHCGTAKKDVEGPNCDDRLQPLEGHSYVGGFNREKFLAACGLEESKPDA